jgi:hypothetical protein
VELKTLFGQLVNDVNYQTQLRHDFRKRRVHPTIEALVWHHTAGKPTETIALTGQLSVNARIEDERRAFGLLDLTEMEELAAESQRLVDRAMHLAEVRSGRIPVINALPEQVSEDLLGNSAGSDNTRYVTYDELAEEGQLSGDSAGVTHLPDDIPNAEHKQHNHDASRTQVDEDEER